MGYENVLILPEQDQNVLVSHVSSELGVGAGVRRSRSRPRDRNYGYRVLSHCGPEHLSHRSESWRRSIRPLPTARTRRSQFADGGFGFSTGAGAGGQVRSLLQPPKCEGAVGLTVYITRPVTLGLSEDTTFDHVHFQGVCLEHFRPGFTATQSVTNSSTGLSLNVAKRERLPSPRSATRLVST